jgi:hypothetical protein
MNRIFSPKVKAETCRRPNKVSCHSNPQAQGRALRKSPAMRQINDELRKGATKLDTRLDNPCVGGAIPPWATKHDGQDASWPWSGSIEPVAS